MAVATPTQRRGFCLVLAGVGIAVSVWLVCTTDLPTLRGDLQRVSHCLWVAFGLELARMLAELWSTRIALGRHARQVPFLTLLRAQLVCFAFSSLMPAGRALGETAKAATLTGALPAVLAGTTGAVGQIMTLLANGCVGLIAAAVALHTPHRETFALICVTYGVVFLVLGGALALALRSSHVASWLARVKLTARWSAQLAQAAQHSQSVGVHALLPQLLGRALQALQLALLAATLARTPHVLTSAPLLQAIYTIGAAAGDLMPAQVGAVDAAFSLAHAQLQMSRASLVALGLALHAVQVTMALACCLAAAALSHPSLTSRTVRAEPRRQAWET